MEIKASNERNGKRTTWGEEEADADIADSVQASLDETASRWRLVAGVIRFSEIPSCQ